MLFGSDGGNAEALARRLAADARSRGFADVTVKAMDSMPLATLGERAAAASPRMACSRA